MKNECGDQCCANEPMEVLDKGRFAFASCNAAPARIRRRRANTAP